MKSGFDDAFRLDERSLLAASLAYKVWGPVYFRADFRRQWVLQPGQTQITAVDSFTAGMATFIAFGGRPPRRVTFGASFLIFPPPCRRPRKPPTSANPSSASSKSGGTGE